MDPLRHPRGSPSNSLLGILFVLIFSGPISAWDPDMPGGMKLVIDGETYTFTTDLCSGGVFFKQPVHIELTCMHGYFLRRPNGCAMKENYILSGENYACQHVQKDKFQLSQAFIPVTNPDEPMHHTITLFDESNSLRNLRRYTYVTGLEGKYEGIDSDPAGVIITNSQKTPSIDLGKLCYQGSAQTTGNSFMTATSKSSGHPVSSGNFFKKNCNITSAAFTWGRQVVFNFTEGYSGPDFFQDEVVATMEDFPEPTADSSEFEIWGGLAYCLQANITEYSNGSTKMSGIIPSMDILCTKEKREVDLKSMESKVNETAELERKARGIKKSSPEFDALMTCVSSCWGFGTDKCHRLLLPKPTGGVALCPPYCDGPPRRRGLGIRRRPGFGRPGFGRPGFGVRPGMRRPFLRRRPGFGRPGLGIRPVRRRIPLIRRRYWKIPMYLRKPHWYPPMRRRWRPPIRPGWPRPRPYRSPPKSSNFRNNRPNQSPFEDQSMMRTKYMFPRSVQSHMYSTPGMSRHVTRNAPFNRAFNPPSNQRSWNGPGASNARSWNDHSAVKSSNRNGQGFPKLSHTNDYADVQQTSRMNGHVAPESSYQNSRAGDLYQNGHAAPGDLYQNGHAAPGDLYQNGHAASGDSYQNGYAASGASYQNGRVDPEAQYGNGQVAPEAPYTNGHAGQEELHSYPDWSEMPPESNGRSANAKPWLRYEDRNSPTFIRKGPKGNQKRPANVLRKANTKGFLGSTNIEFSPAEYSDTKNNKNRQGRILEPGNQHRPGVSQNIDWNDQIMKLAGGATSGQSQAPMFKEQLSKLPRPQVKNAIKNALKQNNKGNLGNDKNSKLPAGASDAELSNAAEDILRYATSLLETGMAQNKNASPKGSTSKVSNTRAAFNKKPAEPRPRNKVVSNRHRRRLWPNRILTPLGPSRKNQSPKLMPSWIRHQPNVLPGFSGDKVARDGKGNVYMQISMNA
ncbi:unnamed protein product [Allacma fusca]|uniref:Uncharacterized protein n=1 Tax=Allacma fusca TaxID=39272 RepID=A0A8J2MHA4_9HEXA|nr:unnamed protein product [Allacma fusca]